MEVAAVHLVSSACVVDSTHDGVPFSYRNAAVAVRRSNTGTTPCKRDDIIRHDGIKPFDVSGRSRLWAVGENSRAGDIELRRCVLVTLCLPCNARCAIEGAERQ
ncbi:hypothetical protein EVAR_6253_1 [Eumeta japonica]|uniref:Uncharacterized protein n=1 Tax=Eumeta variegata TaxID=151549 RepID=A0A4C1TB66_EUMVA|nr:hypothetical protein EVAR_6253_1 [Eumeta japonica]